MSPEHFYRKADRLSALVDIEPSPSRRFRLASLATKARYIGHSIKGRWAGASYDFDGEELAELSGRLNGIDLDIYRSRGIVRH